MRAVFVTAIGTDCGKTHVASALLREIAPRKPFALKPLMTGYDPAKLEASDAGRLLAALGRPVTLEAIGNSCWRFLPEYSAPNVAARRAGMMLDYDEMIRFLRSRMIGDVGLVEGAGGVMSPLTDQKTNIDLMADLRLPVLLLTANYLGAVSHTLTALEALERRDLKVSGIVVSQPWPKAGPADVFLGELARWTALPLAIAPFARSPADDRAWSAELAQRLFG